MVGEPSSAADGSAGNVRPAKSYRVQDAQVLSAASFLSGYVSYVPASTTDTPIGGVDEQADQDEHGNWRRSSLLRRVVQDERQAGLNASTFFHTGNLGHELKFGFGYRDVRFGDAESWPGDQLVGYGSDSTMAPASLDVTRAQNPKSLLHLYDAFLGDTVSAGRLTVNAGLRFDYQQGKNVPSDVAANPVFPELLPAVHYGGDAGYPITWRLLQPRVGATYALGEGRTLLRASYSRFVDSLDSATIFALNPFPGIATLEYFWNDANRNGRVEKEEVDQTFVPGSLQLVQRRSERSGGLGPGQSAREGLQAPDDRRVHPRRRAADRARPVGVPRIHVPEHPQPRLLAADRDDSRELSVLRQRHGHRHGPIRAPAASRSVSTCRTTG